VAESHRADLTECHASGKAGDAARMGTEIPSKREGSRSGLGIESLSLPENERQNLEPEARHGGRSGDSVQRTRQWHEYPVGRGTMAENGRGPLRVRFGV